jgi:hypothetical protein
MASFDDQPVAGVQSLRHHPAVADGPLRANDTLLDLAPRIDNQGYGAAAYVAGDSLLGREYGLLPHTIGQACPYIHVRQKHAFGIGKGGPQCYGTCRRVDRDFGKLQPALDGIDTAVGE